MNAKTLKTLVVATLVCVAAAFAFQKLGGPGSGQADLPDRVAPGLAARLNEVAAIEITGGEGALSLARAGEEWTVASKDGYPAKFETVKQLLVALAELAPRERKTADPARYGRLGLAEPGEGVDALGITLTAPDGSTIAGFVLGAQVNAGSAQQRYVRAAGDPQAWLAEGRIEAPTDAMRWLDPSITQIARDRIARVTINHPGGEVVSVARAQGAAGFALEGVPGARTPKSAGEVGAPANALASLRFDDVRAAEGLTEQAGEPVVTVYETTDGLRITIRSWQLEGKTWASLAAEATTEATTESTVEPEAEPSPTPTEGAAPSAPEAAALNARLLGWLFAIPDYQAGSFRKRLADLTDAREPAAPEGFGGPAGEEPVFVPSLDAADDPHDPHDGG